MNPGIRRVPAWVASALLACPPAAAAQPAAFEEAFSRFAAAIAGTFGDEGSEVDASLDAMANALAEWDRAIAAAQARVAAAPPNTSNGDTVAARLALGRMLAQRGRSLEALRSLDDAAAAAPQQGDIHLLRGLVLSRLARPADAAGAFRAAWLLDPADPVRSYHALRHAAASGDTTLVDRTRAALASAYAASARNDPRATSIRFADFGLLQHGVGDEPILPLHAYARGYAHLADGEYDAAVAALRQAAAADPLVADPASRSPDFLQAVRALRDGRLTEARALVERVHQRHISTETRRVLGLVLWAGAELAASVDHLEGSIRLAPGNERARLMLARVLAAAGRDAAAERALDDTTRLLPDSGLAHWWLARTYEQSNRPDQARRAFARAAAVVVAGGSELLAGTGRLAAGAADLAAAADAFSRGLRANVNDAPMHMYLGSVLRQQDRSDEAFAEFAAAALLDPADARAHLGIGELELDAGRPEEAVAALRRALHLSPALTAARYALATALARLGDHTQAAREYARVEQEQRAAIEDRRRTLAQDVLNETAAQGRARDTPR